MNFTFFNFKQRRQEKENSIELLRQQNKLIENKNEMLRELQESKKQALSTLSEMFGTSPQTLNKELYGSTNPYQIDCWAFDNATARRKSRIAEASSLQAKALVGRFVDMVIGSHLSLQAAPIWQELPGNLPNISEQQKQALIKKIELRWHMWAKSKNSSHNQKKNYYQVSRALYADLLVDGEYFLLNRYSGTRSRNPLSVQQILPENVCRIDSQVKPGNEERQGIEYDKDNREVAYHVIIDAQRSRSTRIEKIGPRSGRVHMIHETIGKGERGTGILVGLISEVTKISDARLVELQAFLMNALIAFSVETEIGGEKIPLLNPDAVKQSGKDINKPPDPFDSTNLSLDLKTIGFSEGGIIVDNLGPGQKIKSHDTTRPTANFNDFVEGHKRELFASRGAALSTVEYKMNGNYSAARGELLLQWFGILRDRFDHENALDSIVYKMWLWGEVERGKIFLTPNQKLAGWTEEEYRDAWSSAQWVGPQRPDIDPMRSFKALQGEINEGLKDRDTASAERGGSGDALENIGRLKEQNAALAEARGPLVTLEKTTYSNSKNDTRSTTKTIEGAG